MKKRPTHSTALPLTVGILSLLFSIILVLSAVIVLVHGISYRPEHLSALVTVIISFTFTTICIFCGVVAHRQSKKGTSLLSVAATGLIVLGILSFLGDTIDLAFFGNSLSQRIPYFVYGVLAVLATAWCFFVVAQTLLRDTPVTLHHVRKWALYTLLVAAGFCVLAVILSIITAETSPHVAGQPLTPTKPHGALGIATAVAFAGFFALFGIAILVLIGTYLWQACQYVSNKLQH